MDPCYLREEFPMAVSYIDFKRGMSENVMMEKTELPQKVALVMHIVMEYTCTEKNIS